MSAHGDMKRGHWISELELEKFLQDARVYGCLPDARIVTLVLGKNTGLHDCTSALNCRIISLVQTYISFLYKGMV